MASHGTQADNSILIGGRAVKTVLIDLDDCCYQIEPFPRLMARNIQRYMEEKLSFPADNISAVCADLYMGHGTTLAGLVSHGYRIDFDDWHAHAHGVLPYELVRRDERLRAVLQALPLRKWVFTNADRAHAERCLKLLGIRDCFEGIICFESTMAAAEAAGVVRNGSPVVCKPSELAMKLALQAADHADAATTLFCDDSVRNIASGHAIGMHTVLVGKTGANCGADVEVPSLHQLPAALPQLFPGFSAAEVGLAACDGLGASVAADGACDNGASENGTSRASQNGAVGIPSAMPNNTNGHAGVAEAPSVQQTEAAAAAELDRAAALFSTHANGHAGTASGAASARQLQSGLSLKAGGSARPAPQQPLSPTCRQQQLAAEGQQLWGRAADDGQRTL